MSREKLRKLAKDRVLATKLEEENYRLDSAVCTINDLTDTKELPSTYVINLDRSVKRYDLISTKLNNSCVEHERFRAIDGYQLKITNIENGKTVSGKNLHEKKEKLNSDVKYLVHCTDDDSALLNIYHWPTTAGELGCWCSHYKLMLDAASKNENIIVFEDDMFPLNVKNFRKNMVDFVTSIPESFDVGFIDFDYIVYGFLIKLEDNPLISVPSDKFLAHGMHAYIISPKGISKLLSYPF